MFKNFFNNRMNNPNNLKEVLGVPTFIGIFEKPFVDRLGISFLQQADPRRKSITATIVSNKGYFESPKLAGGSIVIISMYVDFKDPDYVFLKGIHEYNRKSQNETCAIKVEKEVVYLDNVILK